MKKTVGSPLLTQKLWRTLHVISNTSFTTLDGDLAFIILLVGYITKKAECLKSRTNGVRRKRMTSRVQSFLNFGSTGTM
jgi:hypothetical protein